MNVHVDLGSIASVREYAAAAAEAAREATLDATRKTMVNWSGGSSATPSTPKRSRRGWGV